MIKNNPNYSIVLSRPAGYVTDIYQVRQIFSFNITFLLLSLRKQPVKNQIQVPYIISLTLRNSNRLKKALCPSFKVPYGIIDVIYPDHSISNIEDNLSYIEANIPYIGDNLSYIDINIPYIGDNLSYIDTNIPYIGDNLSNIDNDIPYIRGNLSILVTISHISISITQMIKLFFNPFKKM